VSLPEPVAGVVVLTLLATACGPTRLYDGPARSGEEVAVVSTFRPARTEGPPGSITIDVRLSAVDGKPASGSLVEVLPGRRVFELTWTRYRFLDRHGMRFEVDETHLREVESRGTISIPLEARAGRRYRLRVRRSTTGDPPVSFVEDDVSAAR
jgi:hypothetical protein